MQSSAKSQRKEDTLSPISLILINNISGPSTVPCGTPDFTGVHMEIEPTTITCCFLQVSLEFIQEYI